MVHMGQTQLEEHGLVSAAGIPSDDVGVGHAVDNVAAEVQTLDGVVRKGMSGNLHVHLVLVTDLGEAFGRLQINLLGLGFRGMPVPPHSAAVWGRPSSVTGRMKLMQPGVWPGVA